MLGRAFRRGLLFTLAIVLAEAAYAVLRPAPVLEQFDPSGEFGDPTNPEVRVAVLGDSSVTAPGVASPDEIWIRLVCRRLAETHFVVLESYAVGGSMAHDLIENQLQPALDFDPDLVFVSVGANDLIKGVSASRFEANLEYLIGQLSRGNARVVQSGVGELGSIPRLYPPLRQMMSARARQFDAVHWRVAEVHGATVVDQRSDDLDIWFNDRDLWADDLFHVSAEGHRRWAETTWRTVEPIINALPEPA